MTMKKIILSLIALICAVMTSSAQINLEDNFGLRLRAGLNISNVTGSSDAKWRLGLVAGVEGEYAMTDNFAVSAGAFYSRQGTQFKDRGIGLPYTYNVTLNLDYVKVPVMLNYYILPGLAIKAGIQPGFLVNQKVRLDGFATEEKPQDVYDNSKAKVFELSVPMGLSYQISNFVIDARYNLGITNIYPDIEGIGNHKNSYISVTIGYALDNL